MPYTPFFSILVPTYNQAQYLPAALDSLLAQTYSNWEAVIVNDGSTDDTPRVLDVYVGRDARFRSVHKENGGVATALNEGLRHARGEWICWLSSDDLFEPDALAIFAEALRQNPDARFFHSDFSEMDDQTGIRIPCVPDRHHHLPDEASQVIAFFRANYVHGISIAVHRSVFEVVGTFNQDLRYAQDVDMWLRISARYQLHHIDRRTCITRVHDAMGTVGFAEAGPMDVARSCLDFLNRNRFPALFPFLNLRKPEHLVAAINVTMQTMMTLEADMYRGIGFVPALLERFGEWLWCDCEPAVRETVVKALVPVAESLKASLPERLSRALDGILTRTDGVDANYRPHDYYVEFAERYHELLTASREDETGVLERYMKIQKGEAAERLGRELARISTAAVGAPAAAVGSRLAHRWLDGLKGLEIGASAHNAFGLNTRNVGIRDAIYEAEQMRLTGTVATIHIEALADAIPVGDESEDFIFSSHVIEHCPNLIKTLLEWFRIVRKDGLIYMIVPHRHASPSDVGRPLTEWQHVLADFANQADGRSEPDAGQLGHCHYHVFDIAGMRGFIAEIFSRRLELVDYQEVDDKIGNGFTLVYRKTVSLAQALPWSYWERLAAQEAARNKGEKSAVNIGMITYNRLEFTQQAIEALVKFTDYPYILTVVDNKSEDGTREYLQEQKRKGIIKNLVLLDENIGVAKASNIAWSLEPDAGYYLKLDNDIVIQKNGWLGDMVRIIDDEQSFGALAYSFEPTSYPLVSVKGHSLRLKNGNLGGACFLIPARTRGKIGFWCEDYGLYSEEDYDYCFRLSLAGLRYAYMADEEVGFHLPAGKAAKIDENSLIATDGVEETSQQTYRLWKDEIRRQTISSGLRDRNLLGYKNGTKSIYSASHYVTAWINAGRPGLVLPSFNSASPPPLKVAVFSHDGSHHACGYYRVYSPAKALGESVSFTWPVKTENGSFKIDLSGLHECDLFIIQRFFPHEVSMPFIEQLMGMGKPMIFELDDLITDIPADNSTHDWAQQCQPHIEELLKKCVAITVSTEELGIKLSCYNEHVYVLPNLIDLTLWRKQAPRSCGPVVIGYAGTMTHASDIALLEPVLERLSAKYGNNVAFTFMGCATERLSKLAGFQFIPFELSFEAYAKKLQDTPFDIMLAPLEDNVFNRCKSNIKWLEYSSCGIAGVYADLPPYNTSVKQGETGLLVGNDAEQWFQAICLLIEQPALRRKIAEQSRNEVLTNYTLDKNAGLWLEAYQEIMEKFHNESLVPASMAVPQQQDCKVQLVSIVIPVFNQLYFTQQCLQALFETLPTETGCEIIVVNNASSDGTAAYLHGLGEHVRVISNATNLGFAKACNQGAQSAQGKYLLFLNNDTVVQPGWLEPLLKAMQSGEADICGARLLYPDGRCQHAGIAFDERGLGYHIFGGFPGDAPEVTQRREMQAVTGACLMISKQLFAELEGFDEEFHNGFEDVDLCLRAGEYGKKILYLPESVVIHYAEQTPGRKDHDIPNMQRFFKRWSGKLRQDDQQLYRQFGLTCSKDQEGRFRIARDAGSVPQVSIIIPLFNQVGLTQACLAALQRATKAGSYELVLVDNGSTDGTAELLEQWRHAATVIRNLENGGFAKACNQGARAAQGEYLLFLNNDTVVQHGWLEPLLEVLEQDASVAATGSKLLYPDGTIQHAGVLLVDDQQQGDPLVARHLYQRMPGDHPAANMLRSMQALTAACLLVRRTDFETVGGFDEGYWNGYEDVDLCLKLAAAGKRLVYQPASVVVHHESQSGPERFRQAAANIQRLHQRWLGKVQVDAIINADGAIQHGPGMLSGTTAIYQPPAAPATVQAKQPTASARPRQYQLVPLVAGSASSLLQRLSSSRTTRDVLQRYTTDV